MQNFSDTINKILSQDLINDCLKKERKEKVLDDLIMLVPALFFASSVLLSVKLDSFWSLLIVGLALSLSHVASRSIRVWYIKKYTITDNIKKFKKDISQLSQYFTTSNAKIEALSKHEAIKVAKIQYALNALTMKKVQLIEKNNSVSLLPYISELLTNQSYLKKFILDYVNNYKFDLSTITGEKINISSKIMHTTNDEALAQQFMQKYINDSMSILTRLSEVGVKEVDIKLFQDTFIAASIPTNDKENMLIQNFPDFIHNIDLSIMKIRLNEIYLNQQEVLELSSLEQTLNALKEQYNFACNSEQKERIFELTQRSAALIQQQLDSLLKEIENNVLKEARITYKEQKLKSLSVGK